MSRYGEVFQSLGSQPLFVITTVLHAALAALFLAGAGSWLPLLLGRRDRRPLDLASLPARTALDDGLLASLTLSIGGGLVLSAALGTASAFLLKQVLPGMLVALGLGLMGTAFLRRQLRRDRLTSQLGGVTVATITLLPILLGLWLHLLTAFPNDHEGKRSFLFSDLHRDSGFHIFLASIVGESGLPLIDLHGSPTTPYSPVTHTGHGVLIAGLAGVLNTDLFQASTALWIVSLVLLTWAAAMLLSFSSQVPKSVVLIGSLSVLVIGPLTTPPVAMLTIPQVALAQGPLVSARMYWNLPQALSTALVA
ncbi:MAG: hypothetical protein KF861_22680, partial [Planctomycetaceae bacterium]|nr:hypothetical protein [Planctomycetaceae bacterium]